MTEFREKCRLTLMEPPRNPLTYEHVCNGLCEVEESIEGLSFCPRKFICNDKMIIDIKHMEFFIHLQDLNLAFNAIEDIRPLQKLTLLQKLDCSFNQISEIPNVTWPFLVYLNLNDNRITKLPKMSQPILQILCLNHNLISSLVDDDGAYLLEEDALPRLHTIELRGNRLSTSLPNFAEPEQNPPDVSIYLRRIGFSHSGLKMLVMAENSLSSLAAVYHPPEEEKEPNSLKLNPLGSRMGLVPGLVVLHLRKNGIKHLHGFTAVCFASLEYLNLRDNEIESVNDLKPLSELPKLRCLVLTDNPIQRVPNYRMETLMTVLTLRRLDKDNFSPEEVVEAKLAADRRRQEEAAARAAEEIGASTPPPMPSAEGQN